jgi:uncharacterized membrane protein YsdA (DUF1294 family)
MTRQLGTAILLTGAITAGLIAAGLKPVFAYLAGISLTTLIMYGYDKRQAVRQKWRVRESVLHLLAAAGGTPGAIVGQLLFRHKTRDTRFRIVFLLTVVLQVVLVVAYFYMRR